VKYTKDEVQMHSDGWSRANPAVNVKVYGRTLCVADVVNQFGCSEEQAEQAIQFAWESAQEAFWDDWTSEETIESYFPYIGAKAYGEGRSDGWLAVHNLPDVETWDAIMLSGWREFEKDVLADVKRCASKEQILDAIAANEWHKEGSERYNFCDTEDGKTVCIADLKQQAIAAGFGPVVRR